MARIKIQDLPKDMKISKAEMKNITGGVSQGGGSTDLYSQYYQMLKEKAAAEVAKDQPLQMSMGDHIQSLSEQVQSMSKKQSDSVESVGSNSQK